MAQGSSSGDRSKGRPVRRAGSASGSGTGANGSKRSSDRPRAKAGDPGRRSASSGRGGERGRRSGPARSGTPEERTGAQQAYDGPEIPSDITGRELDRSVAAQLQGLPEKLALRVARHLVAAGRLVDEDPVLAYAHAQAARARASRLAVVREACGEAAYAAGEFADAVTELRAARRMNGSHDYLPMIADCERALGKPEKAIALARSAEGKSLPEPIAMEMLIVEAGARRDLGEFEAALRTLESAPLHSPSRQEWSVRVRYAYADTLEAAGRAEEAAEWFHRAAAIDNDGVTDADERAGQLDVVLGRSEEAPSTDPDSE